MATDPVPVDTANARPALIALESVRTRLASVWLVGGLLVVATLVLQSLLGRYGTKVAEAWGWLLPSLMPTLTMIITVLGYSALSPTMSGVVVRKDFFQLAFWLSTFYIVLIATTILIQPFAAASSDEAIALMQMSNLWLGPMQGLVSAMLGVLFFTKDKAGSAER